MDRYEALVELEESTGYEMALVTTFNIDVEFFERYIVSRLYNNGIHKIALLVDAQELNKGLSEIRRAALHIGKRYSANPISISGAFHPKLLLLLAHDKAKLIVSSANCTSSGYITNNEIFNVFETSGSNVEHLPLIQSAVDFFINAYAESYKLDDSLIDEVKSIPYLNQKTDLKNGNTRLLHNLDRGIVEQISEVMDNVKTIDIAVPFYDNNMDAVSELIKTFPKASINLYIQNHKTRINIGKAKSRKKISIKGFDGFNNPKSRYFYHGKVFRFVTKKESWILYGSANCTLAALCKSYENGGNIECDILEQGSIHEFDYFFDNIIIENDSNLECDLLDVTGFYRQQNYYYKYGIIKTDGDAELTMGCSTTPSNLSIRCNEEPVDYTYDKESKSLVCMVDSSTLSQVGDVLTIIIEDNEGLYEIVCWLHNSLEIEVARTAEATRRSFKIYEYPKDNEFYENLLTLRKYLALCASEYQNQQEIAALFGNRPATEVDEDDTEEAPEGIIEYVIPARIPSLEDKFEYDCYQKAGSLSFKGLKKYLSQKHFSRGQSKIKTEPTTKKEDIPDTGISDSADFDADKYIARLIRSIERDIYNNDFIEIASTEHFCKAIAFLCYAYNYIPEGRINGLFDLEHVINMRNELMIELTDKDDDINEELAEWMINFFAENHYLEYRLCKSSDEYEPYIIDSIRALNKRYPIRDNLHKYITNSTVESIGEALEVFVIKKNRDDRLAGIRPTVQEVISYIESAIGYKTREQIESLIHKHLGDAATVDIVGEKFVVIGQTDSIKYWFGDNDWFVTEIEKHCDNCCPDVESIFIDVKNSDMNKAGDPPKTMVLEKQIGKLNITRTIIRKSGLKEILVNETGLVYGKSSTKKQKPSEAKIKDVTPGSTFTHPAWGKCKVLLIDDNKADVLLPDGSKRKIAIAFIQKHLN